MTGKQEWEMTEEEIAQAYAEYEKEAYERWEKEEYERYYEEMNNQLEELEEEEKCNRRRKRINRILNDESLDNYDKWRLGAIL